MKSMKNMQIADNEVIHNPHPVTYPVNLKIWDQGAKRIKIINSADFPKKEIFKGLGIELTPLLSSFGVVDPIEIMGRQDIMQWLHKNRKIEKWLLKNSSSFALPWSESDFLNYFKPNRPNPYWSAIRHFVEMVDNSESPPSRILELRDFYYDSLPLEKDEDKMVGIMLEKIQDIAAIEGLMTFSVSFGSVPLLMKSGQNDNDDDDEGEQVLAPCGLRLISENTSGFKEFSFALNKAAKHTEPAWTKKKYLVWINKLCCIVNGWRNSFEMKKAYKGTIISKASEDLIEDIGNGIIAKLRFDWKKIKLLNNSKKRIDGSSDLIIKVYYSYSRNGLQLKIYGLEDDINIRNPEFEFSDYGGFRKSKLTALKQTIKKYVDEAKDYKQTIWNARKMLEIERIIPGLFDIQFEVLSPKTDSEHKWYAIQNLYSDPSVNKIYKAADKHRDFSNQHLTTVREMAFLSKQIRATATKLHTKISFPQILNEGHIVEFEKLYAIHLLHNPSVKKIIPVTGMDALNGKSICFTGKHNGGKTSTALAVAISVFLAQSGLPVIGKGFSFNPKEVLGLVFVSKGEGSTCTNLVDKMKDLLLGIQNIDGSKVILVIDELGIATQESDGCDFGVKVLNAISRQNASLLFTTQITKLAEYSVEELGGISYRFERDHKMFEGIGDGGLEQLCEERGLNEFLT